MTERVPVRVAVASRSNMIDDTGPAQQWWRSPLKSQSRGIAVKSLLDWQGDRLRFASGLSVESVVLAGVTRSKD